MSASADSHRDPHLAVRVWLLLIVLMILAMVVVGGATRLTGSGLSMVEWRPLMGVLPPSSEAEWRAVFERYQASPQYAQVNGWMELEHFKRIFAWEYAHRLLGRLVGVFFALPFLVFVARRRLPARAAGYVALAFLLGGAQGLLGWYMVASGLVDVPAVSHYRLAAHLMLAFVSGMYVLWLALELGARGAGPPAPASRGFRAALAGTLGLLLLQIVYGAFMAGTRAGHVSSTFPDMNGHYGPSAFFHGGSVLADLLDSPAAIHWTHRALGYLVAVAVGGLFALGRRESPRVRRGAGLVLGMVALQLVLGVGVVVMQVPIWLAVVHQAGAYLLLACATWLAYEAGLLPRGVILKVRGAAPPAARPPPRAPGPPASPDQEDRGGVPSPARPRAARRSSSM